MRPARPLVLLFIASSEYRAAASSANHCLTCHCTHIISAVLFYWIRDGAAPYAYPTNPEVLSCPHNRSRRHKTDVQSILMCPHTRHTVSSVRFMATLRSTRAISAYPAFVRKKRLSSAADRA